MSMFNYLKVEAESGKSFNEFYNQDVYIACCLPYTLDKLRIIAPIKGKIDWGISENHLAVLYSQAQEESTLDTSERTNQNFHFFYKTKFLKYKKDNNLVSKSSAIPYFGLNVANGITKLRETHFEVFSSEKEAFKFFEEAQKRTSEILKDYVEKEIANMKIVLENSLKEIAKI